ncbi:hypothetical protein LX36DRAFT_370860 [Colletotrichum falcatum]|nr:hypothetical protein LX36DRAFT_370860 [Colletotrichum falcatum]
MNARWVGLLSLLSPPGRNAPVKCRTRGGYDWLANHLTNQPTYLAWSEHGGAGEMNLPARKPEALTHSLTR